MKNSKRLWLCCIEQEDIPPNILSTGAIVVASTTETGARRIATKRFKFKSYDPHYPNVFPIDKISGYRVKLEKVNSKKEVADHGQ